MTFIIFFHCFSEKVRLDVLSEASARQTIHRKNQTLFSSKDNKKLKCCLLQFLFDSLRVKTIMKDGPSESLYHLVTFNEYQQVHITVIIFKSTPHLTKNGFQHSVCEHAFVCECVCVCERGTLLQQSPYSVQMKAKTFCKFGVKPVDFL